VASAREMTLTRSKGERRDRRGVEERERERELLSGRQSTVSQIPLNACATNYRSRFRNILAAKRIDNAARNS